MQFLLRHELGDWADLSSSKNEGLLCYQKDNVFIITKAKTLQSAVSADEAVASYFKQLSEEVTINHVRECTWNTSRGYWRVFTCNICCPVSQYTVFACCNVDGVLCTLDAVLPGIQDYKVFVQEFSSLVEAIEFRNLSNETASLKVGDAIVTVSGNTDVCLRSAEDDVLIFVGKNKYFTVTSSAGFQNTLLNEAKEKFNLVTIYENENERRFCVKKGEHQCGTLELKMLHAGGKNVEILGYWLDDSDATIENELSINVEEAMVTCIKGKV